MNPYIENILPDTQAGFRPIRSTVDQVTQLTAAIEDGFDHRGKSVTAYIDLTAAYDTVWHHGLCLKFIQSIPDRKNAILYNEKNQQLSFHAIYQ